MLTGAGVSTGSGIPDYRDPQGRWKSYQPIKLAEFLSSQHARQRYWLRSMIGWRAFANAAPNQAHYDLARLEAAGHIRHLVTQNVDRLHQRAGHRRVTDLHGRLDRVICLDCHLELARAEFQDKLKTLNPKLSHITAASAPDGDAFIETAAFDAMTVPGCPKCQGIMKPAVVMFGASLPQQRVMRTLAQLASADRMLVVGSSLMVYSGLRFVRRASELGMPIAAINMGITRADSQLTIKYDGDCRTTLAALVEHLGLHER